jgi:uncharacterized protein (DUF427 family)
MWHLAEMSSQVSDIMRSNLGRLRHQPTEKRIRATVGDATVADTRRALLVWEPRRIVPSYAVPVEDLGAELVPSSEAPRQSDAPVLHPGIPFSAHSTEGEPLDLRSGEDTRSAAAFRPADPDLSDHVVLDFDALDAWFEEDEQIHSHPRDPFHRVDVRRSSLPVRVEVEGVLVAETTRPSLAFETNLPTRFYFPREDVKIELAPTDRRTFCPYKGEASYWSFEAGGRTIDNLLWSYEDPLEDARGLTGLMALFDEVVDVTVDGKRRERPDTEFARVMRAEFGLDGEGSRAGRGLRGYGSPWRAITRS